MLRTIKKDNCGYSLKHYFVGKFILFIESIPFISIHSFLYSGSEGTLGYITKVAIQLYPAPRSSLVLFAQVRFNFS